MSRSALLNCIHHLLCWQDICALKWQELTAERRTSMLLGQRERAPFSWEVGSSSTEREAAADVDVERGEASLPACVAVEVASGGGAAASLAAPT